MFPNPQEALPLPPHPSLEQYKKRAKDLVKACRSGDREAIRAWAIAWLDKRGAQVADYAIARLTADAGSCALTNAQFVIARAHGFESWPKFAAHIEALERAGSSVFAFESAVDAVVAGDADALGRLLGAHPGLVRERSTREHHATLLVYTSANGVEGYRQKSPRNAAAIAKMLIEAGADVEATAAVYASECTTLGLVATSTPPQIAGVQIPVIDELLAHGGRMDRPGLAGHDSSLVRACFANGQPEAAAYLASRGAPLDLSGAAGLGRVDALAPFFDDRARATSRQLADAFALACAYGRREAVEFLLDHGLAVDAELTFHGAGHTGLHVAAYHGHAGVVTLLLGRGASVHVKDKTWKTPPLSWVLTGWARKAAHAEACYEIVARLVRAGAFVAPEILEWDNVKRDPRMRDALQGKE